MYFLFWLCWKLTLFYQFCGSVAFIEHSILSITIITFVGSWKKLPQLAPVMQYVKECYTVTLELLILKGFCVCSLVWFVFFCFLITKIVHACWNSSSKTEWDIHVCTDTCMAYLHPTDMCVHSGCVPYSLKITSVHCWNHVLLSTILIWKKNRNFRFTLVNYYSLLSISQVLPLACVPVAT